MATTHRTSTTRQNPIILLLFMLIALVSIFVPVVLGQADHYGYSQTLSIEPIEDVDRNFANSLPTLFRYFSWLKYYNINYSIYRERPYRSSWSNNGDSSNQVDSSVLPSATLEETDQPIATSTLVPTQTSTPEPTPTALTVQIDEVPISRAPRWSPPILENPITIDIQPGGRTAFTLDLATDYILQMPDQPIYESIAINGGRNVVMMGGEINIPYQGENPSISSRRGLKIQGSTGVVHIEGVLIRGEDLSKGIQINAPNAIVQLQTIRIEDVHARDQVNFSDNHPDLIQTFGNVKELRVDHFTGSTDYRGFFLSADYNAPHGPVKLSNINIIGRPTARFLIWFNPEPGYGDVNLENVWLTVPEQRQGGLTQAVYPAANNPYPNQGQLIITEDCTCMGWPTEMAPRIFGVVREGMSPIGDFVKIGAVGVGYTRDSHPSPEDLETNLPTAAPTDELSVQATIIPTETSTAIPTSILTDIPPQAQSVSPIIISTEATMLVPTNTPTTMPTDVPTLLPTNTPTTMPTDVPTLVPTNTPTTMPTDVPTLLPTNTPTMMPTDIPTLVPTNTPTTMPTDVPIPIDDNPISNGPRWSPPNLENPIIIDVEPGGRTAFSLDPNTDYILQMPDQPIYEGIAINGGRNVVMMGGEINIPNQGKSPSISSRRGLKIQDSTGVVHIEGVLIRGEDLSEGIQISAPNAIVQLQTIRIEDVHARDQVNFSDNHPDLIQTYGNVKELRVDHFTGSTDYQGFFLSSDYNGPHGSVKLSNVNIIGRPTARFLIWFSPEPGYGNVNLENVWLNVPAQRQGGLAQAAYPATNNPYPTQGQLIVTEDCTCMGWPEEMVPRITGVVREGSSPIGDFVKAGTVGVGYTRDGFIVDDNVVEHASAELTSLEPILPTASPTDEPTIQATIIPTDVLTAISTTTMTSTPTPMLTVSPTDSSTVMPTTTLTDLPTLMPTATLLPTDIPTEIPSEVPTLMPTATLMPTEIPTEVPTLLPTNIPTDIPTEVPTDLPTEMPTQIPPTDLPTETSSDDQSNEPTVEPTSAST